MANIITVKGGSSTPTISNLEELELGFDKVGKKLFIRCNNEIIQIGTSKEEIINSAFPINSIFITTNSANPGTYLGGTWEAFGTGRTLIAVDGSNTSFNTVEKTGGTTSLNLAHTHTTSGHILTTSEMPSHSHSMTHTHSDTFSCASNSHSHTMSHSHSDSFSASCSSSGSHFHAVIYDPHQYGYDPTHSSSYSTHALGLDGTNASGVGDYTFSYNSGKRVTTGNVGTNKKGSHTHTISISGSVSTYSGSTSSSSHSHTISGSVSQYSGSTGTSGSGNSHSHGNTGSALDSYTVLPPYITVYMWKRTA